MPLSFAEGAIFTLLSHGNVFRPLRNRLCSARTGSVFSLIPALILSPSYTFREADCLSLARPTAFRFKSQFGPGLIDA